MNSSGWNPDPALLEVLACPKCKGVLRSLEDPPALVCERCRLRYPVCEGLPVLLVAAAEPAS